MKPLLKELGGNQETTLTFEDEHNKTEIMIYFLTYLWWKNKLVQYAPLFSEMPLVFEAPKKNSKAHGESALMGGDWKRRWQKKEKRGRLLEFSQNSLLFLTADAENLSFSSPSHILMCICAEAYFLSGHVSFLCHAMGSQFSPDIR